ncbi:MAG: PhzF family phenazine biosynthesis protein [Brevibacillus sp.]|nr:PhzF family phenazine biosynthesis protein [Brevibacillus sp.]
MKFYLVDVFAERKYQGNQLAVLIPDQEISTTEMQQIAREINFSETAFIMSDKQPNGGYDVRIFTPDVEVPFAGHPTLGTAFVIEKFIEQGMSEQILLNLKVGQIPVKFQEDELTMEQKQPSFGEIIGDVGQVAQVLQIDEFDIDTRYPIQVVSTGLPSFIVPLKTVDSVRRCSLHHDRFQHFIDNTVKANLLVFAPQSDGEDHELRVRVYTDDTGSFEDPATGSANGNLAGYLLQHNFFQKNKLHYRVRQGYEIGRQSLLKIKAEKINETFRIQVGGKVFLIATGEWL